MHQRDLVLRAWVVLLSAVSLQAGAQVYSCSASTTGTINFLAYNPAASGAASASATAALECRYVSGSQSTITWSMQLSNGSSGTCAGRSMPGSNGGALSYNIYQNSLAGGVWGNSACGTYPNGTLKVSSGQRTSSVKDTLYGQIGAGQWVPVGAYAETLTLTFSY